VTVRLALAALLAFAAIPASARTVWRCVRDGTVSLATAPEPGSECFPRELDDAAARLPNLWGSMGIIHGTLYRRTQDGRVVYGTRKLPGSEPVLGFTVATPAGSPAHTGLGRVGAPRMDAWRAEFRAAARATGLDEAWLRAIAHAESAYDARAISAKGAKGVMQLMPQSLAAYRVGDAFSARESIMAGARMLKSLRSRYEGDLALAAAAYNAGPDAVAQYGGVPPYAETQEYVAKVGALYARYRKAMGKPPRALSLEAAQ